MDNQKINTEDSIEISGHFYNYLLSNLEKVSTLYEEIGDLKEKIGYFKGRLELGSSVKTDFELNNVAPNPEAIGELFDKNPEKFEALQNIDDANLSINENIIFDKNSVIETDDQNIKEDKKISEINNSLRRSGFWMFFVSAGTILINLWIRNFVILQEELITLIGIFGPISIGGLITVIRPKGPGIFGWLILISASLTVVLDYFEIINIIEYLL